MSILKGKKVAILGGMGSRGEARDALIKELELADLEWVYSERNKVKEYAIFCRAIYPGKYDYIFVLTKFISHKLWDHIKKANIGYTPLIRVNGSYNTEGLLKALSVQLPITEQKQDEPVASQPIIKKLLAPAERDDSEVAPTAYNEDGQKETHWESILGAKTPEEVKARHDFKVASLEAQIKRLQDNQQDIILLKSAASFYNAFSEFVGSLPVPSYLNHAKANLFEALKKNKVKVEEHREVYSDRLNADIMLSNIILSHLFASLSGTIKYFRDTMVYDRYGACIHCRKHKSVGCQDDCPAYFTKEVYDHIIKGLRIAEFPSLKEVDKFLKTPVRR